jgi:hypothetical protein
MGAHPDAPPALRVAPRPWAYAWWLIVGALLGLGIEALLTIGAGVLLAAGVLGLLGSRLPALQNRSAAAVPAGVGLAVAYLAWINRGGPGTVCETTSSSMSCTDEVSPWPFVAVAVLLVVTSVALVAAWRRSGRGAL